MRYIIDTNILVFAITNRQFLNESVSDILSDLENIIYVSSSSIFELIHLNQTGRIKIKQTNIKEFLKSIQEEFNLTILHSKNEHFYTYSRLPLIHGHNDPIDRIIIAQSITEKIPLISSDTKFKYYKDLDFIYNDKKAR